MALVPARLLAVFLEACIVSYVSASPSNGERAARPRSLLRIESTSHSGVLSSESLQQRQTKQTSLLEKQRKHAFPVEAWEADNMLVSFQDQMAANKSAEESVGSEKQVSEAQSSYEAMARAATTRYQSVSSDGKVPSLMQFQTDMTTISQVEDKQSKEATNPEWVKLLIGVLSMGYEGHYREIVRKSWMSRPGACKVDLTQDGDPPYQDNLACRYYVTFVLGHNNVTDSNVSNESRVNKDIVQPFFLGKQQLGTAAKNFREVDGQLWQLDGPSAEDKSYDWILGIKLKKVNWLRFAAEHFRWATHIATADLDTYPFVDLILKDIRDPQNTPWSDQTLKPKGWSENKGGIFYGATCGGEYQVQKHTVKGFKQGAFTCLSRGHVECMFKSPLLQPFDYLTGTPCGDVLVTRLVSTVVKSFNPGEGTCHEPWWIGPSSSCEFGERFKHPV